MTIDCSVYGILDPSRSRERDLAVLAGEAIKGGVTLFQLRDKSGTTRAQIEQARAVLAVTRGKGVPLLINDRIDVALASGADGVHIGNDDMAPEDARRLLGDEAIIGVTIHSIEEARAAPVELVDYFGVGGVFATTSKHNPDPPIGVEGLAEIRAFLRERAPDLPAVGIAGVTSENAASVIAAGADGACVISDIFMADDVEAAASRLADAVHGARGSGELWSSKQ